MRLRIVAGTPLTIVEPRRRGVTTTGDNQRTVGLGTVSFTANRPAREVTTTDRKINHGNGRGHHNFRSAHPNNLDGMTVTSVLDRGLNARKTRCENLAILATRLERRSVIRKASATSG
jgi:hypothetical protein